MSVPRRGELPPGGAATGSHRARRRWPAVTIRARLAVSYGLVIAAVLVVWRSPSARCTSGSAWPESTPT